MEKQIIAVIPARGGSKRVPRKNLLLLRGKPLLAYSIEHAKRSRLVDRIIVSTDDDEIADVAIQYDAEVIKRPPELSGDTASSETALLHVVDWLAEKEKYEPDILVFLQCTSPLRNENDIDNAIGVFLENNADSLFSACRFNKYIWRVCNGAASPINYDYRHRWREQDFPHQVLENGSIFVFKTSILKELGNRLGGKIVVYEMDELSSIQIDSNEDIMLCKCIMDMREKGCGRVFE
jgi:CMP-N,N'-diacetyllegionaminic acid synthase